MKRSFVFSSFAWMILLLSMTGCGYGKNEVLKDILPTRIENITDKDVVPEGSEGALSSETYTYDASARTLTTIPQDSSGTPMTAVVRNF